MAQQTEIYVDPSINADSGSGTLASPYGDLEYALEKETFDLTNGTRVNVKVGIKEILAANLATAAADTSDPGKSVAWGPTLAAPLTLQGYDDIAGDGGKAEIDGGGTTVWTSITLDSVHFKDLKVHNCGSNSILRFDNSCSAINVDAYNTSGNGIFADLNALLTDCNVTDVGSIGMRMRTGIIARSYLANGAKTFSAAIDVVDTLNGIFDNIIKIGGSSNGIDLADNYNSVERNSIWSNAGSGTGLLITLNDKTVYSVLNNLFQGFSDPGGVGLDLSRTGLRMHNLGGNTFYDNETHYKAPGDKLLHPIQFTKQDITAASKANPCVITYSGDDNFVEGSVVYISGIAGMTQLNGRLFTIGTVVTGANTFQLSGEDSTGHTTYTSGGSIGVIVSVSRVTLC